MGLIVSESINPITQILFFFLCSLNFVLNHETTIRYFLPILFDNYQRKFLIRKMKSIVCKIQFFSSHITR
ncbi:hypothetical protein LEP1GSC017_2939 [Leptospira meyeri serovar Hardjo str. Went 5]|nr:hypothetical protein LEP1GSC017_2939 [Leptospira meyeri serovar Hardjo str. Went 5]EMJ86254.1 hypothetical protein LEP1GSC196_3972 [Leptospira meyeri serovar Semaranga str. Veldrot Semarang 173]